MLEAEVRVLGCWVMLEGGVVCVEICVCRGGMWCIELCDTDLLEAGSFISCCLWVEVVKVLPTSSWVLSPYPVAITVCESCNGYEFLAVDASDVCTSDNNSGFRNPGGV